MANYFSSNFTLGILGGGQLGKMMLYETRKFDITTHVLDPSLEAPCRIACDHFTQGDLMDYDTVYTFGKKVDILTFEIEGVNIEALEALEKEGKKVYPSSKTLRNIQDKGVQKKFYDTHKIPTAPFSVFETIAKVKKAVASGELKLPFVWKSCTGGYDGKGVQVIKNSQTLDVLPDCPCITEDLVAFKNELAVIVVRNPSAQVKTYPVVEMEFHPQANQVEYVICPARIDDKVAAKARSIAIQVSKAFEHVGLLAVEMFQTNDDQIIVNEVAPRPHNSGHYSIEASYTNQFEQHIRAILDLPLGNTASKVGGIMVNLVGEQNHTGDVAYQNIEEIMAMDGVTPHIYGKKQTRPFRKMGHVTIVNQNIDTAREIAQQVKQRIKVISK
ncbi:5-(carboxyamino)imidazole ribonucleotide synthase [Flavobacteriaceae bacterium]|jgi:5-(carboxyamino)imidazole ribonucleotide synthase|nr:5-(carboxyamino)imidazole ribonucleotide synthase [Flavobacteriaceae bacterium]MDB2631042.1 5-(carboxyamino)imidazole ribonucleotide synthase [Ulvibacter sp.]MDA9247143.1 5-(carboxyamino)imidazole ribonucleotide synthase [Flavobacteriaceae bacterium]MDA9310093.1 5-(carboxyamino)imidazole ribonucleotide synthase [Flavobacteriaceae bacterium]MDB4114688.1 5-(carboxyamino)imidazole ribonucleotide synthase [Flavobacteriaceae bacterium]